MRLTLLRKCMLTPAANSIFTTSGSFSSDARCNAVLPSYRDNKQILNTFNINTGKDKLNLTVYSTSIITDMYHSNNKSVF